MIRTYMGKYFISIADFNIYVYELNNDLLEDGNSELDNALSVINLKNCSYSTVSYALGLVRKLHPVVVFDVFNNDVFDRLFG